MTTPARTPDQQSMYGPYFGVATPRWCSACQIHQATTHQPLCPVCLDDVAKELRGAS